MLKPQNVIVAAITMFTTVLHAQTLTATRGLFSTKDDLTREERRRVLEDSVVMSFLADGNVRTVLTGKSGDAPTPAAGALGVSFGRYNSNLTVLINVIGTADTVKKEFGSSLLPPTSGGATSNRLSFLVDFRQLFPNANGWGWHTYLSGAPVTWADTASTAKTSFGAFVVAAGAQVSREVYNQDVAGTSVSLVFDAGPALRVIQGDLSGTAGDAQSARRRLLTTGSTTFLGAEAGMSLQVKEVRLGVSYYFFGGEISGLSKGQAVFGFAVANSFFAGRAKKAVVPVR